MKREILFRGQKIDTTQWIQGDLIYEIHGGVAIETPSIHHRENNESTGSFTRVKPETIGQFIGLTDKNGLKAFEGEIYQWGDEKYKLLIKNGTCFLENDIEVIPVGIEVIPMNDDTIEYEIENKLIYCTSVGNIHDNPELLNTSF